MLSAAEFLDLRGAKRTSLKQFPWKHRDAEGAPGSVCEPGAWNALLFFLELTTENFKAECPRSYLRGFWRSSVRDSY